MCRGKKDSVLSTRAPFQGEYQILLPSTPSVTAADTLAEPSQPDVGSTSVTPSDKARGPPGTCQVVCLQCPGPQVATCQVPFSGHQFLHL